MNKLMLTMAIAALCAQHAFGAESPANADKAAAAAAMPAGMPAYGKDKPLPVPQVARKKLANGLEVWVLPRTGVPRVDMVLAVRDAGLGADDAAHPGFANLLAELLTEGSARRDSRAIAEAAQGMGGAVGARPSSDGMMVTANALASQAGPMMNLLAEVALTPAFPEKEVALAKANALQSLRVLETRPRFRADRAMDRALYGDHPYGHTAPSAESISTTNVELLRAEHARRLRPERALLVITGRISEAEAMRLAQGAFGDWKASGPAATEAPKVAASAKPVRLLLERAGSVQSTIRVGGPGIAATAGDQIPLRLAGTILGGGFSSRVNLKLREEKGYTYGANAGAALLREGGNVAGGADVRNEVTGAALADYLAEYKRLDTELVSQDEMRMHKRYVAGSYLLRNQMQGAVAGTLAGNWLVGLPAEFLGQYVPLIEKVTPEQVRTVAKKYFAPEKQSIVVVGDPKAVGEQLKPFGEFTVTDK
jgi:zinc protease